MQTQHTAHFSDAAPGLDALADASVQLVVTSPPYPMIEMWDELFGEQDADARRALGREKGQQSFELMHERVLKPVWKEAYRVLQKGGVMCVNIGDATRKIGGQFQLFPNHARVISDLARIGFSQLPGVLWRKPASSPTKFMGAGMLGLNAYTTLEHEHILVFRKGGNRKAASGDEK
ncbi:MAG: modification methylase, partial [Bacteroidetes bacterium QS_1_65_9]